MPKQHPLVLAITGASGAVYATRLLQILCHADREIHLTISPSGAAVIKQELGLTIDVRNPDLDALVGFVAPWTTAPEIKDVAMSAVDRHAQRMNFHAYDDYMTPIASGSFRTSGMIV
jgi:4-hydroxy-3-polyprenylbenzoate decarboxylase